MSRRILIYHFSGTGNALAVAGWIQNEHELQRDLVTTLSIAEHKRFSPERAIESDYIYLVYPTHGFNAPPLLWSFMQTVKVRTSCRFILINTRAGGKIGKRIFTPGLNGLALYLPAFILRIRGHKITAFHSVDMPSNWISLHPGFKKQVIRSITKRRRAEVKRFVRGEEKQKNRWRRLAELPFDLLVSPIALPYYFIGRFALAKTFFANYTCTGCGKCIRECPTQALVMKDERPFWTKSCESCMHCMGACPTQSVETAHGFTALLWWAAWSLLPASFITLLESRKIPINTFTEAGLWLAIMMLSLPVIFLSYRILHFLLGFKWFNRMITYTSLTHLPFWRKYLLKESKEQKVPH